MSRIKLANVRPADRPGHYLIDVERDGRARTIEIIATPASAAYFNNPPYKSDT